MATDLCCRQVGSGIVKEGLSARMREEASRNSEPCTNRGGGMGEVGAPATPPFVYL
jgi:hypothetical protein